MKKLLVLLGFTLLAGSALAAPPYGLPEGNRWLKHLNEELLPFWNKPDAWGTPIGNFPTFRCNDGSLLNFDKLCREAANAADWVKPELKRQYVRMHARQVYAYGMAYHLTGESKYLELARAGVDYFRKNMLDPVTGVPPTYFENGKASTQPTSSQDLAYAELGMAFYYYLTRDPDVLHDILRLKSYIFNHYVRTDYDMIGWVNTPPRTRETKRKELVAQLDQVNAYMMLLAPILPEPFQSEWKADLRWFAKMFRTRYYNPATGTFRGTLHLPDYDDPRSHHNDFGHSIKTYWMLERIGHLTDDKELIDFATAGATKLLRQAYVKEDGSWSNRPMPEGARDLDKDWWIFCELNQTASTLALSNPAYAEILPKTYAYWFDKFVDHKHHDVWLKVLPNGKPRRELKTNHWKNAFHHFEHAAVAYLTTQALAGETATLHFAVPGKLEGPMATLKPYLFDGDIVEQTSTSVGQKVVFKLKTTRPKKPYRPFADLVK